MRKTPHTSISIVTSAAAYGITPGQLNRTLSTLVGGEEIAELGEAITKAGMPPDIDPFEQDRIGDLGVTIHAASGAEDAPLDEANTGRLARLLKEMASETQFIVITHAKRTMEAASALYGVTMEEPGVSTLISVKLGDLQPGLRSDRLDELALVADQDRLLPILLDHEAREKRALARRRLLRSSAVHAPRAPRPPRRATTAAS